MAIVFDGSARLLHKFLYLLPNGFSYPTTIIITITMAFLCAGYIVFLIGLVSEQITALNYSDSSHD